jgi:glycogen debranching enzyme
MSATAPVIADPPADAEWLEADGQGGFAFGTADTICTRRYHGLLVAAPHADAGRLVLVNAIEAWIDLGGTAVALASHRYQPGIIHPDGATRIATFALDPWPRWTYGLPDGSELSCDVFAAPGSGQTSLQWRRSRGTGPATLHVRPLLSGRDYHALHHENPAFRFDPIAQADGAVTWQPYPDLPPIAAHGGVYAHDPLWFRQFLYAEEAARGLDCLEDLASPGVGAGAAGGRAGGGGAQPPRRNPAAAPRGAGAARRLRRPADADRGVSVVHRLGARHVHRPARRAAGDRPARGGARRAAGLGRAGQQGDAAQPLSRRRRAARVQRGRCIAVVCRRGA